MVELRYTYRARYRSAYDGDTVRVDIDLGFGIWFRNQALRLIGIDTPELRGSEREAGLVARNFMRASLRAARELIVETTLDKKGKDKKGKYGRWLARLHADGVDLNQAMIDNGYAKEYWGGKRT